MHIKLRDPRVTLSKTFLLPTIGCTTQTVMCSWLLIANLCTTIQQYRRAFLYQKYICGSEKAVHLLRITDGREYTTTLILFWTVKPNISETLQNGLVHHTSHSQPCPTCYSREKKQSASTEKHTSWKQGTSTWSWGSCLEDIKKIHLFDLLKMAKITFWITFLPVYTKVHVLLIL